MAECAYCGEWLSREYARVNGGNYGRVLCRDCGGPGPEFKPESAYNEKPGTIPRYKEGEMADEAYLEFDYKAHMMRSEFARMKDWE